MRPLLAFSLACVAGCSGQTFGNADIATYVGKWVYPLSSIAVQCATGNPQMLSGSGQITVAIASDDASNLAVTFSDSCPQAELAPQTSGYNLTTPTTCDAGMLTAMHLTIDEKQPNTLQFSSTTQTMTNGASCTRSESGTATRSQ